MVAFDTMILIWGVRRQAPPGREDLVDRCVDLIKHLKEDRTTIMVPSLAVAEYLVHFSAEDQKIQQAIIGESFFVAPFDMKAAAIAGELYDKQRMQAIRADTDLPRQCLKADLNIVATSIAHGATRIYVDDRHFRTLAHGRILVNDVPPLRDMQTNFLSSEDKGNV